MILNSGSPNETLVSLTCLCSMSCPSKSYVKGLLFKSEALLEASFNLSSSTSLAKRMRSSSSCFLWYSSSFLSLRLSSSGETTIVCSGSATGTCCFSSTKGSFTVFLLSTRDLRFWLTRVIVVIWDLTLPLWGLVGGLGWIILYFFLTGTAARPHVSIVQGRGSTSSGHTSLSPRSCLTWKSSIALTRMSEFSLTAKGTFLASK
mmetsp:Transcript_20165/g.37529  ORF Transcript_20165/g.37529 Transcript_20165/m.37529 type:complete len:204 (-) Transcript_20165:145-756(-)